MFITDQYTPVIFHHHYQILWCEDAFLSTGAFAPLVLKQWNFVIQNENKCRCIQWNMQMLQIYTVLVEHITLCMSTSPFAHYCWSKLWTGLLQEAKRAQLLSKKMGAMLQRTQLSENWYSFIVILHQGPSQMIPINYCVTCIPTSVITDLLCKSGCSVAMFLCKIMQRVITPVWYCRISNSKIL